MSLSNFLTHESQISICSFEGYQRSNGLWCRLHSGTAGPDKVVHSILIDSLRCWVSVSGTTLKLFSPYLSNRTSVYLLSEYGVHATPGTSYVVMVFLYIAMQMTFWCIFLFRPWPWHTEFPAATPKRTPETQREGISKIKPRNQKHKIKPEAKNTINTRHNFQNQNHSWQRLYFQIQGF